MSELLVSGLQFPDRQASDRRFDALLSSWTAISSVQSPPEMLVSKVRAVTAFVRHTLALVQSVRVLQTTVHPITSLPLIRVALESAVNAHWVLDVENGERRMEKHSYSDLVNRMDKYPTYFSAFGSDVRATFVRIVDENSSVRFPGDFAGRFKKVTEGVPGDVSNAWIYDELCDHVHPKIAIVESYAKGRLLPSGDYSMLRRAKFETEVADFWWAVAVSLAAMAVEAHTQMIR